MIEIVPKIDSGYDMMHTQRKHAQLTAYKPHNQDTPVTNSNGPLVHSNNYSIGALLTYSELSSNPTPHSIPHTYTIWMYAVQPFQTPQTLIYHQLLNYFWIQNLVLKIQFIFNDSMRVDQDFLGLVNFAFILSHLFDNNLIGPY